MRINSSNINDWANPVIEWHGGNPERETWALVRLFVCLDGEWQWTLRRVILNGAASLSRRDANQWARRLNHATIRAALTGIRIAPKQKTN